MLSAGPPIGGILFDIEHWIPFIFCSSLIGAVFVLSCILHFRTSSNDKTDSSGSLQAQMEHSTSSTCATDHTEGSSILTDGIEEKSYSNSNIEEKSYMQKVCGLLCDKHITVTLGVLLLLLLSQLLFLLSLYQACYCCIVDLCWRICMLFSAQR